MIDTSLCNICTYIIIKYYARYSDILESFTRFIFDRKIIMNFIWSMKFIVICYDDKRHKLMLLTAKNKNSTVCIITMYIVQKRYQSFRNKFLQ